MQLPEINFSELEIREIGLWPLVLRIPVIIAIGVLTVVGMYFLMIKDLTQELETQHKLEDDKRAEFKTKFNLAANLDAYRKQMVDIEASYKQVSRELPSASQVPQLIDTISQEAQTNGLIAQSLKPGDEKNLSGFYKQLPISIVLSGNYNGIAGFVSGLAKIPRIVTLHDFTLKRADVKSGGKTNRSNSNAPSTNTASPNALPGVTSANSSNNSASNSQTTAPNNQLVFSVEARTYWLSNEQPEPVKKPGKTTPTRPGVSSKPGASNAPGAGSKDAATSSRGGAPAGAASTPSPSGGAKGVAPTKPSARLPTMPGEIG